MLKLHFLWLVWGPTLFAFSLAWLIKHPDDWSGPAVMMPIALVYGVITFRIAWRKLQRSSGNDRRFLGGGMAAALIVAVVLAVMLLTDVLETSPGEPAPQPPWAVADDTPPCHQLRRRFYERVASTKPCTSAADCGCYNPVAAGLGCGGVTDAESATALAAIQTAFHDAACEWPLNCAPQACEPECRAGRCE